MTEAKTATRGNGTHERAGDSGVREVFLSPRVVDREAFNDFSGALRKLIELASGQSDALKTAIEQAGTTHQQLRDLATKHTSKFEAAARVVNNLDERAAKADQMVNAVTQAAASLQDFKAEAQKVVADQTQAMQRAMEDMLAALAGRLETTIAQAQHRLELTATQTQERLARTAKESQDRLETKAAEIETRVQGSADRAHLASQQMDSFATLTEQRLAEARQTISGYEARGVQSIEDAAAGARRSFDGVCELLSNHAEELRLSLAAGAEIHREKIDQHTDAAVTRAREAATNVVRTADATETRIVALAKQTESHGEEQKQLVSDMLFRAEEAAGEVEALVGLTTALPDEEDEQASAEAAGLALPGSLADLILKARAHRRKAEIAFRELDATTSQAEHARQLLGESINDGAAKIDALSQRADLLRKELGESLEASERAVAALAGRRAEAEEIVREPLAQLRSRTEQTRSQMAAMDSQAARAKEVSEHVVERTTAVVRGLSELMTQLKPWHGLLIDNDPTAAIPPALRGVIDQIRSEIAGDLATIASGLQHVAMKAQRTTPAASQLPPALVEPRA